MNVNIVKMEGEATKSGNAEMRFVIEVKSIEELNAILKKIRETKNVLKAFKVNEKVVIKQ